MDGDAREMTEPERKIENFVRPCTIGIRDNANLDESNEADCSNNVRSNGERIRERVTILLMLTTGLSTTAIVCVWISGIYLISETCTVSTSLVHNAHILFSWDSRDGEIRF